MRLLYIVHILRLRRTSCFVLLLLLLLVLLPVNIVKADREHEEHGFSGKFKKEHYGEDGEHNAHADHRAFVGARAAAEFDSLSPEESKRRLGILAKKMDKNGDGYVDRDELFQVIKNNIISLDLEEADERFKDTDTNQDSFVTFDEYLTEAFGDMRPEDENIDADDKRLMEEDRKYFEAADLDKDGKLSGEEYRAFQNPESFPHMHKTLTEISMAEKDKNGDGKISLDEFIDEMADKKNRPDLWSVEKDRFEHYFDTDNNGFLEGDEIAQWLVVNVDSSVEDEVNHLMANADTDRDKRLSVDEIMKAYDLFVGSDATSHGDNFLDIPHDEL